MPEHLSIPALIPQRPPFVMVDDFVYTDEENCHALLRVRADNILAEGEFLSESGLVENIAQTAAARAGYLSHIKQEPVQVGYIGAVQRLEVWDLPRVGDEIKTDIKVTHQVFNATLITGSVWRRDDLLARCDMKIFISNQL